MPDEPAGTPWWHLGGKDGLWKTKGLDSIIKKDAVSLWIP
jgi:hypothetical protein